MKNLAASWDAAVSDAQRLCAAVRRRECRAYQFCDGFDNYNSASALYETVNGTISFSTAYRRFSPPSGLPGQGIKIASGGSYVRKNLQSNQQTLIVKVAVNFASLGIGGSGGNPFILAFDAGTVQWSVVVFSSGAIGLERQNIGSVQAQSGPGVISAGLWYSIEVQVTISGSSSTGSVWVNGFEVINATTINMQVTGNAYANQVAIGDYNGNGLSGMLFDDFRVWDGTGSTQNAALGTDSRLVTKLPSGAGDLTGWTPNGAAANWQCVDDNPPDGDTTYTSSSTASNSESYAMPSAGFTAAPSMIVARAYIRKDDGATRTFSLGIRRLTSSSQTSPFTIGSSYAFVDGCIPDDPVTSAPCTAAQADALEFVKEEVT